MTAHSRALRKGRISETGRIYLITTTVKDREPLFGDFALARAAIHELRASDAAGLSRTLAFVLMPDHLHWLVQLESGSLALLLARYKKRAASAVNRVRGTAGRPVWQTGFHDRALRREESLRAVARYVVTNPVRAGLVRSVRDYPHWDAVWL